MTPSKTRLWLTLLVLTLLQACSGGSPDSSENTVENPPAPPQDGITGRVSSRISGALLSVQDATGEEIVLASGRTTNASGTYHLIFSEFAIEEGIVPPLVVTMNGNGATAVCDYDRESDNDCITSDGSLAAFGSTYTLPNGFELRGLAATFPPEETRGDRTVTVNLSAASDLAARYALDASAGNPLTAEDISLASNQALGVVEFVTGLSTQGRSLNNIAIADLTVAETKPTDSLSLALFGASLHGQINTADSGAADYRRVLNRVGNRIRPNGNNERLTASGTYLSEVVASFITSATAFQASLPSPSAVLAGAIAAQTISQPLLGQAGGNPVSIALPADPNSNEPLDRTRIFASRLSEVIGSTLLISQTAAFGGTAAGAETVYTEQISLISTLVSQEVRNTLIQLDDAIATALTNGETELTGTNVSGVLESNGDTVTMTVATSTSSNIRTGISVNVTIPTGTRTNAGAVGSFDATEVTISVSQTQNDLTTQQLYEGALVLQMEASGANVDTGSFNFSGNLRSTSGLNFSGEIVISDLAPVAQELNDGTYDASFTFADGANLTMVGQLQAQINSTTVTTGSSTIMVDLVTNTITDMATDLNLTVDQSGAVTGGTMTSNGTTTGTMDISGILSFSDGTASALPAPII